VDEAESNKALRHCGWVTTPVKQRVHGWI